MSAEQVAVIPQCEECRERWLPDDEERWRGYLHCDGDVVLFCPECGWHEFGERRSSG